MAEASGTSATAQGTKVKRPLAITMGEPAGISGEITAKAWHALKQSDLSFFVIDDPERLAQFSAPISIIKDPEETHTSFPSSLPVLDIGTNVFSTPGTPDVSTAEAVIASIKQATTYTLSGQAGAVVTNPIQKATLQEAGFKFPGHTEFLADLTKHTPLQDGQKRGPIMMLAGPQLRTIPATVHMPLSQVNATLSIESLTRIGHIVDNAMRRYFQISSPRLAFAGLNPHAGEQKTLGTEDADIIEPAIKQLTQCGIDAVGPLPADTMFHADARNQYDVAICMYHDQALIPVKTLDFHTTVNVTLGLPIIRTSPDHGTALDLAGKNNARPDSLIAAIKLAAQMAERKISS